MTTKELDIKQTIPQFVQVLPYFTDEVVKDMIMDIVGMKVAPKVIKTASPASIKHSFRPKEPLVRSITARSIESSDEE